MVLAGPVVLADDGSAMRRLAGMGAALGLHALLEEQNGAPSCLQGKAYRGVGLHADVYQRIIEVPESYPAFKAGIRRGDVLADRDIEPDVDGYDTIDFKRLGIPHRLRIKTRWICLR